ncbi:MAG: Nucleolar protein 56, partial [Paramarteilia canceri]
FAACVKLISYHTYQSTEVANKVSNQITAGKVPSELKTFLENASIPENCMLGVQDPHLATEISNQLNVKTVQLPEADLVLRGIRQHLVKLSSDFVSADQISKSQLALSHGYSKEQLSGNNISDNSTHNLKLNSMIIQGSSMFQQIDKDANLFYMRLREWYGYHFPELSSTIMDPVAYCVCVRIIGLRENLKKEKVKEKLLAALNNDSSKLEEICYKAEHSIGSNFSDPDLDMLQSLAAQLNTIQQNKLSLKNYISKNLNELAPNMTYLLGENVASQFIAKSGGLDKIASLPASTIQLLGAEKALFKAIKTRGKTPKYGYIFNCPTVSKTSQKLRGKVARILANKTALLSRIDLFKKTNEPVYGRSLRKLVETRITEFENGVKKSADQFFEENRKCLQDADAEAQAIISASKAENMIVEDKNEQADNETIDETTKKLKKKSKKKKLVDHTLELLEEKSVKKTKEKKKDKKVKKAKNKVA